MDVETGNDGAFRASAPRPVLDDLRRMSLSTAFGATPDGQAILDVDPMENDVTPDEVTVIVN